MNYQRIAHFVSSITLTLLLALPVLLISGVQLPFSMSDLNSLALTSCGLVALGLGLRWLAGARHGPVEIVTMAYALAILSTFAVLTKGPRGPTVDLVYFEVVFLCLAVFLVQALFQHFRGKNVVLTIVAVSAVITLTSLDWALYRHGSLKRALTVLLVAGLGATASWGVAWLLFGRRRE